jgi:hypothetical protein
MSMSILSKRCFQLPALVDDVHAAMAEWGENYRISTWHGMDVIDAATDLARTALYEERAHC